MNKKAVIKKKVRLRSSNNAFSSFFLNDNYLPFQTQGSSFESELKEALASVNTAFGIQSGLVSNPAEIQNSYYFLENNPFAFDRKNSFPATANRNSFHEFNQLENALLS